MVASTNLPLSNGLYNQYGVKIQGIKRTVYTNVLPAVRSSSVLIARERDDVVGILQGRTTCPEAAIGSIPSGWEPLLVGTAEKTGPEALTFSSERVDHADGESQCSDDRLLEREHVKYSRDL